MSHLTWKMESFVTSDNFDSTYLTFNRWVNFKFNPTRKRNGQIIQEEMWYHWKYSWSYWWSSSETIKKVWLSIQSTKQEQDSLFRLYFFSYLFSQVISVCFFFITTLWETSEMTTYRVIIPQGQHPVSSFSEVFLLLWVTKYKYCFFFFSKVIFVIAELLDLFNVYLSIPTCCSTYQIFCSLESFRHIPLWSFYLRYCVNKSWVIYKNTTTLFSFQNMFRCFKYHHQPLWIYSKDLKKWSVYITIHIQWSFINSNSL